MTAVFQPYVMSHFALHSLTSTTQVLPAIVGGLTRLPLAKLIDVWGRPQGFAIMIGFLTLGLAMMAACNNVKTFTAAQVFYWIGQNGMDYILAVFVADTSSLSKRGLMFAFLTSPWLMTSWVSGPLASLFLGLQEVEGKQVLTGLGWRWGFGIFAVIAPLCALPLFALMYWQYKQAVKAGLIPIYEHGRSKMESVKYYLIQFDAFGLLLLISGFAVFLLPFNLYSRQPDGFASAMVIGLIVLGACLLVTFALWERFGAPVTYLPYWLYKDRNVIGANLLACIMFFSFYLWNGMFISFLQVVAGQTITQATYIGNIYSIGCCLWSLPVGALILKTGRFKWQSLYFGVPITIIGAGFMIRFRQPDVDIGYIIMCQVLIALGGGTLVITWQTAVMSASTHQYVAVLLAQLFMFSSIGGAVGQTVSTAIWTSTFKKSLMHYLPKSELGNVDAIYSDLTKQLAYELGSPGRLAIQAAYADSLRPMYVAAVAVLCLMFPCVMMWRSRDIRDFKQVKGTVV